MNERDIFIAALQQPTPEARRAYLDRACGGDQALRRRVQALLDAHGRAGKFLEPPLAAPPTAAPPPTGAYVAPDAATAEGVERPGAVIGPYKLLQTIGEGGMGAVFLAEQTEPVRRRVALKLIKPGLDSAQVVARFEAERQALALMDHPNIARILDGGATTSGRPYFVMELVKGVPLTGYCDEHRLTPRQRLELFIPVCEAVEHAHQKGVIHRDLKPSNVLVALYDGKPVPKVIDFGVAKAAGQPLTEKTLFTAFDSVVGTPQYMSPEQAQLNQLDVDTRSDVYSLGVMLYELLTGSTPVERERLKGVGLLEVLRVIREEEPPRPSTRLSTAEALAAIASNRGLEPKKLTGLLRGELDWIVMKCLEKDRRRRYEHAHGLARDIGRFLHDEPVQAHPPDAGYRLKKFLRRHGGPVLAAAAVLLVLVGGVVGTTWGLLGAEQARQAESGHRADAENQRDAARNSEARATDARNAAVEARDEERLGSYAADTLLASRAVTEGPLSRAVELLDAWLPERRDGKDYRGREWHLLRRLCDASEKTLVGHEGPLRALAWSADGKRLASGGADRVIRVWDADTGRCLQTLVGHAGGVFDVAFSPDGSRLVSASADSTVRLWDVDSGQERFVLRGHILPVYAVAFHPDGRRFASGGGDGVVKVWDATNGAELYTLQGRHDPVGRLQFDAAGKRLASCGIVGETILWDLDTRTVADHLGRGGDIVFTPDFATGVFTLPGGDFGVLDVKTGALNQGDIGLRGIRAVDAGRTARVVVVAGTDDAIHVLDRERTVAIATLRGHAGAARRVLLRPDGRKLASAGDDGTVRLWALPDPDGPAPYAGFHQHNVTAVAFSRDGALLATGDYLGTIAVWDARTGKRVVKLGSHYLRRESQPTPLEIGTGKPLDKAKTLLKSYTHFTAGPNARDPIVDCYTSQGHGGEVRAVAFTPDNKTLVSAGAQDFIIWDVASGEPLKEVRHPTLLSSLALSPDGTLAATGCWDNIVRVFRVPSGELVKELEGHGDNVMCVAFHPSGKQLASGGRDRAILVWDLETGAVKHRLLRHANTVSALLYSPDGKRLISGGLDQAIHVWDAQTGEYEATLHGHTEGVTSLAFSADGKWLVSASDGNDDTSARVWLWNSGRFRPGALIPAVSSRGPTAVAVHPVTGDLLVGRQELTTFETRPFAPAPPFAAGPAPARAKAPADDRLGVLGYAVVDELSVWPGGDKGRLRPGRPGGKFLVVAASLPFGRVRIGDVDYRRLMDLNRKDEDSPEPLKFSSALTRPGRFVLTGADGRPAPAQFAGYAARSEKDGFEFMPRGGGLLENLTATPRPDERRLVYLGWEAAADFAAADLRLHFDDDDPTPVPPLVLEAFRPGRPFYPASRDFETDEGGSRLRSNVTRFPEP